MELSDKGLKQLAEFEGLRTEAYKCEAGVWTIGVGHTNGVNPGDIITEEKAMELFKKDIKITVNNVNKLVKIKLEQHQFDMLVSFTFNFGAGALADSTLLKKINSGDLKGAAAEFPKWKYIKKVPNKGLLNRRMTEKKIFEKGYNK